MAATTKSRSAEAFVLTCLRCRVRSLVLRAAAFSALTVWTCATCGDRHRPKITFALIN